MNHIVELDSGTFVGGATHPHNGYYAGDFSKVPFKQPDLRPLLVLTRGVTARAYRSQA